MTTPNPQENRMSYWQQRLADAQRRQRTARSREALRRANRDAQQARMMLRLESEREENR